MKHTTFEYFDYEPTNYSANRNDVLAGFAVLLAFIVAIIAVC